MFLRSNTYAVRPSLCVGIPLQLNSLNQGNCEGSPSFGLGTRMQGYVAAFNSRLALGTRLGGESGIGRTEGGWKFPELTDQSEMGSGNFQPPEVRPIPDSPYLQVCFVFITCHFGKSTKEFTHFSI